MNLQSAEAMGQESNKSCKMGLVKQKPEVSREQERIQSVVLGKAGERSTKS